MPGLFFHPGAPTEEPSFCLEEKSTQLQLRMGEVLVMVKACGLSAVDIQFLKVLYLLQNPHPVGREIAGIIKEVGPNVKFFKPNDEVVGILPLGCTQSGLSTLVAVHEHFIVPKPPAVSWDDAAGAVSEGLGAYTALHYLGHVTPRDIIIVADGALMSGLMLVQLAMHRGARVLATVLSAEEADFLRSLQPAPARVINLTESGSQGLHKACMEETAGLGADLVIDSGVCMFGDSEDGEVGKIHKHDMINLLAVGGRWVTKQSSLQLDPPDCHLLQMRGGSVCFLNTETWMLSCTQLGSFLHILREIMEKLVSGALWSRLEVVPLSKAVAAMQRVQHGDRLLKRVVRLD